MYRSNVSILLALLCYFGGTDSKPFATRSKRFKVVKYHTIAFHGTVNIDSLCLEIRQSVTRLVEQRVYVSYPRSAWPWTSPPDFARSNLNSTHLNGSSIWCPITLGRLEAESPNPAVKPSRHSVPPQGVRRRDPKTGKIPAVKVYGFPFTYQTLEAWCDLVGLRPGMDLYNRTPYALQTIAAIISWCDCDTSALWAIVKGPREEKFTVLKLIVGSDKTERDLQNARNVFCVQVVRTIVGDLWIEPAWYWRDHEFDDDGAPQCLDQPIERGGWGSIKAERC